MKEKSLAIHEIYKFKDVERRKKVIHENIIKIIKSQQEKEALTKARETYGK